MAIEVCSGRMFRAALTARVLLEVRVNIVKKFGEPELVRFYKQLAALNPKMIPPPSQRRLNECVHLTTEKDAHVLAAALECGAAYLMTLDRRHLLTPVVGSAGLPTRVVTPGDFLKEIASPNPPSHPKGND